MRNISPEEYCGPALKKVFDAIDSGMFGHTEELANLINTIRNKNDYYLVCHDFYTYLKAQEEVSLIKKISEIF